MERPQQEIPGRLRVRVRWPLLLLLAIAAGAQAGPVDLTPPKTALGAADDDGYLRLVQELGAVDLGGGAELPLRFDFSSSRLKEKSDFGWTGWNCGVLESKAEFREGLNYLRVGLLCGKEFYLKRDGPATNTYTSLDGKWHGSAGKGAVRVWRADGWELTFDKGAILRLKTDQGAEYWWERDGTGRLTAIRDADGNALLTVKWNSETESIETIETADDRYTFAFKDGFLSAVDWSPEAVSPQRLRVDQTASSLEVERGFQPERKFEWNGESGRLISDGLSQYRIEESGPNDSAGRTLVMERSDGAVLKRQTDKVRGIEREWLADGSQIVKRYLTRPGPVFGALARIDLIRGEETVVLMRHHFGRGGRVEKREWRGDPRKLSGYAAGNLDEAFIPGRSFVYPTERVDPAVAAEPLRVITFEYSPSGAHLATKLDGETVVARTFDRRHRQTSLHVPGRFRHEFAYGEIGQVERKVILEGDFENANARFTRTGRTTDEHGRNAEERFLDGRIVRHRYDGEGRLAESTTVAPDGKTDVARVTYLYRSDGRRRFELQKNFLTQEEQRYEALLDKNGKTERRYKIELTPDWVQAAVAPTTGKSG